MTETNALERSRVLGWLLLWAGLSVLAGCNGPVPSTQKQIERFNQAGEEVFPTDMNRVSMNVFWSGLYRVVPGDVLEFQMPTILSAKSADLSDLVQKVEPYLARVNEAGVVTLPVVGEIVVAGKTLTQIEQAVIDAYYPKYVVNQPTVVCKVNEHITKKQFTVLGLVQKPGVFEYPPEAKYTVMDALAFAGGINLVADPEYVTIYRKDAYGDIMSATVKIDRKSMPEASKVVVRPGDVVAAEITARERANMILAEVFYVRAGLDMDLDD